MGSGRRTTRLLAKFASSVFSSVAGDGTAPTPVTSVKALAQFAVAVGQFPEPLPAVILQPWEGATTGSVLRDAGRRNPLQLPPFLARAVIDAGYWVSRLANNRFNGAIRRLEVTWFGQRQVPGWAHENGVIPEPTCKRYCARRTCHSASKIRAGNGKGRNRYGCGLCRCTACCAEYVRIR